MPEKAQEQQKTIRGYKVARRCDICGGKVDIAADQGDMCTLKCQVCGKEYRFYVQKHGVF